MRGTKQNIKWDRLISFAWFSCQYAAETLRYTRNLNQNITSEREKTPKLKCYLFEASLSMRVFFFALLESHGKFFKGLYRVCWHMIYPFRWRLAKAGVDTWEKRLMGRTEKAGVEYVCWHSHNNLPNHCCCCCCCCCCCEVVSVVSDSVQPHRRHPNPGILQARALE